MNCAGVSPGCVYHWADYEFEDGSRRNKYLVIVGANKGSNYLAVLATSQEKRRGFQPGCNHKAGHYHIPGGAKDWFKLDTWLLLADPVEIVPADFVKRAMVDKAIEHKGDLRPQIANEIRNCLRRCDDVSAIHLALL